MSLCPHVQGSHACAMLTTEISRDIQARAHQKCVICSCNCKTMMACATPDCDFVACDVCCFGHFESHVLKVKIILELRIS
jgi:hypothetical protein